MLKELRIKNFVLIESLVLRFAPGICLLTGETGAGKSIVIDAVEAALGGRVSLDSIRAGAAKATIEATFATAKLPTELASWLEEEGIEPEIEGELTLSREISPRGTRCRIEGQQVTQAVLRRAGHALVDILSQHEHQALMEPPFHLTLLDTFGALGGLREQVAAAHAAWSTLGAERKQLIEGARDRQQQRDFWAYQLQEIRQADLREADEKESLEAERLKLANAEQLRHASGSAYDTIYAGERGPSLYDQLGRLIGSLASLGALDAELARAADQLQTVQWSLREVGSDLRNHFDGLEADPDRLDELEQRLDLLKMLERKYGPGLERVIAHATTLEAQLHEVETADERLAGLEAALERAERQLVGLSDRLSAERASAAAALEAAVESELRELELPDARFVVALVANAQRADGGPRLRASGKEAAEFRIAMNPGEGPKPLAKTASGGEMARVMLALKTVLADLSEIPTLVFDEVDTGISGKAAQAVAEKLAALGRLYQVLCITHLPTVAAMADQHVHLEKRVSDGRTHVSALELDAPSRIRELARLASGSHAPAALKHAEDLVSRAGKFKAALRKRPGSRPVVAGV